MTIEETVRDLATAARSQDSASLRSALKLIASTRPEDPEHRAVVLHFFSTFAHTAELTGVDPETVSAMLQHATCKGAFSLAEQAQLLDIHRTLLHRALGAHLTDLAVAVTSAACACAALGETDRAMLVALLLKGGRLERRGVELLKRFDTTPYRQSLLRALAQGHADLAATMLGEAYAVQSAAEWALALDSEAAWARKALAAALNRLGEFDRALTVTAELADDADTRTLRAWALFGKRRYDLAAECLPAETASSQLARLLGVIIAQAHAYEASSPSQCPLALSKDGLDELSEAQDSLSRLGSAALLVTGKLLAQAGRLDASLAFHQKAVELAATPANCYSLIHLMQLAGWWEAAGFALESAPGSSPAVACLWLQQVKHDYGQVSSQDMADLAVQSGEVLVRAKLALLMQEPCDYLDAPGESPREVIEETLRVNLALAIRARDLHRLALWMDEALFHLLPAPETEFYQGVCAWLRDDRDLAAERLERALELAADFLPAIRCLAAVKAERGDHQTAGALWDKVTKLAPTDGRAFVHRALQFSAGGRIAEGRASLRNYCVRSPKDDFALYCLARLELSTAFRRATSADRNDWKVVERPAGMAAGILERLTEMPEAAWYAWVGRVMQTPPQLWAERAKTLLATEPAQASRARPVEAEWLGGQLRVLDSSFETALEGLSMLAGFAAGEVSAASARGLSAACWRLALQVETAEQAVRLVACAEPMAKVVAEIAEPLDFVAARFSIGLPMAAGAGQQVSDAPPAATIGNLRALLAAGDTATLGLMLDELRQSAQGDERRRLLAGILALELKAFRVFEQVAAGAPKEQRWEILKALALAKQGDKDAIGALCALLDGTGASSATWLAQQRLGGVFAFLGAKARKHAHNRLLKTLAAFPLERVAADQETALNFLRTSLFLGESQGVWRLLDNHPRLMSAEVSQELQRVRCYEAAQAITGGNYAQAATLLGEMVSPGEAGAVPQLQHMQGRTKQLATVAGLLGALSPNPALGAHAARYLGLAELLEGAPELAKPVANAAARERLRNRLAECRHKRPAAEWQAHLRSLAVLHWEWGLAAMKAEPALAEEALECFRFANFLWRHLLTDTEFWTNFAAACTISAAEVATVRERIEAEIFACHREQAYLFLAASEAEACRFHLSCLQDWGKPPRKLFLTPDSVSSPPSAGFSQPEAGRLDEQASAAFEAWVDQVLWRARKLRDDPAALERLLPGMKCDYDAAIKMVGEALQAVPDHPRLCMFLLEQHADCAFALVGAGRRDEARERLRPAIAIARSIANHKFKGGQLSGADGDLIRRVFDYAWKLETDEQLFVALLREYLHWNGADAAAQRQLHLTEGLAAYLVQDYDTAIERLQMVEGDREAEEGLLDSLQARAHEQIRLADQIAGYGIDDGIGLSDGSSTERMQNLLEAGGRYQRAQADFAAAVALRPQQEEFQRNLEIAQRRLEWWQKRVNLIRQGGDKNAQHTQSV